MRLLGIWFAVAIVLTGCQTPAVQTADLSAMDPIDRVRTAYQVDRIRNAKTIRLEDEMRRDYPNHDYSPDFHDMSAQRYHHIIDLKNSRGSSEYLTKITNTHYHGRQVVENGNSRFILYRSGAFIDEGEADFISQYGQYIRSSDPLLALFLVDASDTVRREGEEMWLGITHDKVTFDFPSSPPLTVLIQQDTGYISKMTRTIDDITVSYTYHRHEYQNGIPVAQEQNIYGGENRLNYIFNRSFVLDGRDDERAIEIESDIVLEPIRVDQSEFTIEEIRHGFYQVGQGEAYSSILSTDKGLIAFGVDEGFKERIDNYRKETSDTRPLVYAIVPNHNNIRMAGASDAVELGATLLVTPAAERRLRNVIQEERSDYQIETIPNQKQIGVVTIYNIASSHASQNLVLFDTQSETVVQTSHYSNPYDEEVIAAEFSSVVFNSAVENLGLKPQLLLSTESRLGLEWEKFQHVVQKYDPTPCYRRRRICDGWQ